MAPFRLTHRSDVLCSRGVRCDHDGSGPRRAHVSARKRLHWVHQRTRPSAAITAHAFAGASARSQIGGPSGVRNLREECRAGKRSTWPPVVVCNVAVGTEDEGLAGMHGPGSSIFSLFPTHPPLRVIRLHHMLVVLPRRDSKTLSNATT